MILLFCDSMFLYVRRKFFIPRVVKHRHGMPREAVDAPGDTQNHVGWAAEQPDLSCGNPA